MNLGADDYLTKPFRVPDLLNAVSMRLAKSETTRRLSETRLNELRESISLSLPHEFLTPISGILGTSELLLSSYDMMEKSDILEMLTHLHASARRLSRLIQNFLLHARLIALSVEHSSEEIREKLQASEGTEAPSAVVHDVAMTKATQEHRVEHLAFDHTGTTDTDAPVSVAMRQMYFSKIIEEVVDNALKYSLPDSTISIQTNVDKGMFICTVHNTGRHMTPEQIASIGAYTQFDRKIYEQQGSGLGLSIVKKLLEFHSGRLTITSVEGNTSVQIAVPTADHNAHVH